MRVYACVRVCVRARVKGWAECVWTSRAGNLSAGGVLAGLGWMEVESWILV